MIIGVPKEVKEDEYRVAMLLWELRNWCSVGIRFLFKWALELVPV